MKKRKLKIQPEFFSAVASGRKPFEIRKNDRSYQVGDVLLLREWESIDGYTGREIRKVVVYIHGGLGMADGYVCLGLESPAGGEEGGRCTTAKKLWAFSV